MTDNELKIVCMQFVLSEYLQNDLDFPIVVANRISRELIDKARGRYERIRDKSKPETA